MIGEIVKRLLAIVALVVLLVPPLPFRSPAPTGEPGALQLLGGSLRVEKERVVLRLSGSPYEMGYQQGAFLGPQIRWLLGHIVYPSLLEAGLDGPWLMRAARAAVEHWPPALQEEMRGIADGAGVALADVVVLNLWPDLLLNGAAWKEASIPQETRRITRLLADRPGIPIPPDIPVQRGLSAPAAGPWPTGHQKGRRPGGGFWLAAWGNATADNQLLVFGALDAYPGAPHPVFVERHPDHGLASLGVALPGWVGLLAGLNARQVAVLASAAPTHDLQPTGVPVPLLVRTALERARGTEEAIHVLTASPRSGGAQVLIAAAQEGGAVGVELSARLFRVLTLGPDENRILVTPLPLSSPLTNLVPENAPVWQEGQQLVLNRVAPWLRWNAGLVDREKSIALLTELGATNRETWVALVIAPAEGRLWAAQAAGAMPAPASGFVAVELAPSESP